MTLKMSEDEIRREVRKSYGSVAKKSGSCCGPSDDHGTAASIGKTIGYSKNELEAAPEGANMGLGCGNPTAIASLKKGETVLDLGSGGGFDCFLAADRVGMKGRVIGVDMTPEMIEKARENVRKGGYKNVEFRLGEIENLPAADSSVDVVISNCVINLAPNKKRVFAEAFRVLRPGGRVIVSDVVLLKRLPESIMNAVSAYVACLSGAAMKDDYLRIVKEAGFKDVRILKQTAYPVKFASQGSAWQKAGKVSLAEKKTSRPVNVAVCCSDGKETVGRQQLDLAEAMEIGNSVASIDLYAVKPGRKKSAGDGNSSPR